MRPRIRHLGVLLLGLVATGPARAADDDWQHHFDTARELAEREGKDLLVEFTGSDWCSRCLQLRREVFSHDAFVKQARKSFVLVSLDFPHGAKAKAGVPDLERNMEVKARFRISAFPTVLVMTVDGEVLGETEYREGGPGPYLAHVNGLRAKGREKLDAVMRLIESADFGRMLAALEVMTSRSIGRVKLAKAVKGDEDELGDLNRDLDARTVRALMRVGALDDHVRDAVMRLDPRNKSGLREQYAFALVRFVDSEQTVDAAVDAMQELVKAVPFVDKAEGAKMCVYIAFYCYEFLKDPDAAKPWARRAKKLGIRDKRMKQFVDQLLGS